MRLRFTPEARADLRELGAYYSRIDRRLALRIVDRIDERCRRLLQFPYSSQRLDPKRFGDMRRMVIDPYVVVYRVSKGTVEILRILHGARDLFAVLEGQATPSTDDE